MSRRSTPYYLSRTAAAAGTLKTAKGVAKASIKKVNGLAIASVKTYDTLTP